MDKVRDKDAGRKQGENNRRKLRNIITMGVSEPTDAAEETFGKNKEGVRAGRRPRTNVGTAAPKALLDQRISAISVSGAYMLSKPPPRAGVCWFGEGEPPTPLQL